MNFNGTRVRTRAYYYAEYRSPSRSDTTVNPRKFYRIASHRGPIVTLQITNRVNRAKTEFDDIQCENQRN